MSKYIQNLNRLMRKVKAIGKEEEVIGRALKKEGVKVRDEAKLLCPVDTGNLRNSIRCSQPKKNSEGNWYVEIYTNVSYAT